MRALLSRSIYTYNRTRYGLSTRCINRIHQWNTSQGYINGIQQRDTTGYITGIHVVAIVASVQQQWLLGVP